jgi:hypothetical protein|tara:strand:- start:740 stop:1264 length:525 start_codon:yes stop_codon:yes gene_type:complete
MTKEQKSQLNELLEALKKSDKNSIKCFNEGTLSGVESVQFEKGDDYLEYHRDFECYSHTVNIDATNEELIEYINDAIENNDYSSLFWIKSEFGYSGNVESDDFEYDNYRLNNCSMDDDEIPEEILDEDGEIDDSKLEDNEWSFEIMDQEDEVDDSETTEISISVDDKLFTFKSD